MNPFPRDPMLSPADWPLAVVILLIVVLGAVRAWLGWKERQLKQHSAFSLSLGLTAKKSYF